MKVARAEQDRFRQMLVWSLALHVLLVSAATLAATLGSRSGSLPPPVGEFINVNLGKSGPLSESGGGVAEAKPKPAPEPPPEEKAPTVVRPTKEVRDEIPRPDARVQKKPAEPKPDSGLRGADAASAASAQLAGAAGPPGLGLGGAGGGSPFDQDFEYAYYVQQMLTKIHQRWQRTAVRGTAVVIVRFTIARDGRVLDAEVETPSGVSILDRSALRAVMLADPLPPLPNSYPKDQVGVHLRFTYTDQL
ncbi:MAG TPA: energy transducer TonB [Vicinamibacteria bacterium]|jgi:TonB family protein